MPEGECFHSVLIIYDVHRTHFSRAWVLAWAAFQYEALGRCSDSLAFLCCGGRWNGLNTEALPKFYHLELSSRARLEFLAGARLGEKKFVRAWSGMETLQIGS